ncbi:MAG: O-antigen ligase family protein [bacterium]
MDASKLALFGVVAVIVVLGTALVKDLRKYFLVLAIAFAPLASGIIFYHYNGVLLMDFPLVVLLMMAIFAPEKRFRWSFPGIGWAAFALVFWCLLTCFNATNSGWALSEYTRFLRGFLLFVCIANYVNSPARLQAALYALLGTFAFESMLGSYQWRYGALGLTILEEVGYDWRAAGTFIHPGVFADYLIMLIPLVFRLFAFGRIQNKKTLSAYLGLLLLGLGALLGSYGRGPWVSFAGAIALMLLFSLTQRKLRPRAGIPLMVMVILGIAFAIHYAPTITDQFTADFRQSSAEVRKPLNRVAMGMIEDYPVLGVGLGNYRLIAPPYARIEGKRTPDVNWRDYAQIVHNSFLLIACEAGIPGVLLFVCLILAMFKTGLRVLRLKQSHLSNIAMGLMTGLLALCISINTGPNIMNHQILMMFWLIAGFLTALSRFIPAAAVHHKKSAHVEDLLANAEPAPAGRVLSVPERTP